MKVLIGKILEKIALSATTDKKHSSTRLQSYIVLLPILLMTIIFVIIEIWQFIHSITYGIDYNISSEIIVVFGMLLSHHLAILFSRTKSTKIEDVNTNLIEENTDEDVTKDDEKEK